MTDKNYAIDENRAVDEGGSPLFVRKKPNTPRRSVPEGERASAQALKRRVVFPWILTGVIVVCMVLRMLPESISGRGIFPLLVPFVPYLTVVSAVLAIISLISRRKLLATVSVICVVLQIVWHWGYFVPSAELSDTARQSVNADTLNIADGYARIMTLNTKNGNADAEEIVRIVREEHVEVLALQEGTWDLRDRLEAAGLRNILPYEIEAQHTDYSNGGENALWSAMPLQDETEDLVTIKTSPIPAASVTMNGKTVRFGSVHLQSPRPGNLELWRSNLDTISQIQTESDVSLVLMGDYNSVLDHSGFRAMLGSRFVDAAEQSGSGIHLTYPTNKGIVPAFSEIDHVVYSDGVVVGDLSTATISGTDHKALLATLEVK